MRKIPIWLFALIIISSSVYATESVATTLLNTVQNVFGPVLTSNFWADIATNPNSEAAIFMKVLLWIFLFAILYPLARAIPIFKERKGPAGVVAGVIAFISVAVIPQPLIAAIAEEYSGVATVAILAIPIIGLFFLSRSLPDTREGTAVKLGIYSLVLYLMISITTKAAQLNTPFFVGLVKSNFWNILYAILIVIIIYLFWKVISPGGTGGGWGMEKIKGIKEGFSEGRRFKAAEKRGWSPEAEKGAVTEEEELIKSEQDLEKNSAVLDQTKTQLIGKEKLELEELKRYIYDMKQTFLSILALRNAVDSLERITPTPEITTKIGQARSNLETAKARAQSDLAGLEQDFNKLSEQLNEEVRINESQVKGAMESSKKIEFARAKLLSLLTMVNTELENNKRAYEEAQKAIADAQRKGPVPPNLVEAEALAKKAIDKSNAMITMIQQTEPLLDSFKQIIEKEIGLVEQFKSLTTQMITFNEGDIASVKRALGAYGAGKYDEAVKIFDYLIQSIENRKTFIASRESNVLSMGELRDKAKNIENEILQIASRLDAELNTEMKR